MSPARRGSSVFTESLSVLADCLSALDWTLRKKRKTDSADICLKTCETFLKICVNFAPDGKLCQATSTDLNSPAFLSVMSLRCTSMETGKDKGELQGELLRQKVHQDRRNHLTGPDRPSTLPSRTCAVVKLTAHLFQREEAKRSPCWPCCCTAGQN